MTPWLQDADVTLYHGDVLTVLCELPAESVDCCVTSPPYWGLRDYGTGAWEGGDEGCDHLIPAGGPKRGLNSDGHNIKYETSVKPAGAVCPKCGGRRTDQQLGLEPTPEEYVTRMVEVFREVRRVLASHGTVFLNIGDSYASTSSIQMQRLRGDGRQSGTSDGALQEVLPPICQGSMERSQPGEGADAQGGISPGEQGTAERSDHGETQEDASRDHGGSGEPLSVLRGDGASLSHDRPRERGRSEGQEAAAAPKQKDLVGIPWMLAFALRADGWYLRSDIIWAKPNPMPESVTDRPTKAHEYVFLLSKQPRYFFDQEAVREMYAPASEERYRYAFGGQKAEALHEADANGIGVRTRPIGMREYKGPAGPDGRNKTTVQAADGSIQHRDGERWPNGGRNIRSVWEIATQPYPEAHFATFPEELARRCIAAGCPADGVVLDPFVGSGTVAYVARKLGRHAIGIDLNESYLALAARRLQQQSLFA